MAYTIELTKTARKQFDHLSIVIQNKIEKKIDDLAQNPRPQGVVKLTHEDNLYRIRSGDYRVIYQIQDKALLILVVKIGHRKEIYR